VNNIDPLHKAAGASDLEKAKALLKDDPDLIFSKDVFAGRTLRNCFWPTRPTSMPRTSWAGRLCTGRWKGWRYDVMELLRRHGGHE
jgi:hypothetical protein